MLIRKLLLVVLSLPILLCVSCSENPKMKDVFYLNDETLSIGGQFDYILFDFNGELANDSSFSHGSALCRQQQLQGTNVYYAVFPEANYAGLYDGELEIRLFQHQKYMPVDFEASAKPFVAFGQIKNQKFESVCGGLQVLLKGHVTVTALRFADNDSLDRLWGNYVVRQAGTENQQLLALPSSEGNNEVWLDCPEGVTLSEDTAKAFTVMLPAGALYRGFSMDVFCEDSLLYHAVAEKNFKIRRDTISRMREIVIP